jgi:hypothetical protein
LCNLFVPVSRKMRLAERNVQRSQVTDFRTVGGRIMVPTGGPRDGSDRSEGWSPATAFVRRMIHASRGTINVGGEGLVQCGRGGTREGPEPAGLASEVGPAPGALRGERHGVPSYAARHRRTPRRWRTKSKNTSAAKAAVASLKTGGGRMLIDTLLGGLTNLGQISVAGGTSPSDFFGTGSPGRAGEITLCVIPNAPPRHCS